MIKGPKAILSSAIANALDEYFMVDANAIESNLLKDARIILRRVKLREKVTRIPVNSAGNSTSITMTGSVDEVAFTWSWSVGDVMWVNDAVLTIKGARFQTKLEHEERIVDDVGAAADDDGKDLLGGSFVNPATIDAASAKKIKEQKGGLGGFVARQVRMAIDSLTLKMVDFELRVVLPHPPQQGAVDATCSKALVVGIDKIEMLSFGRGVQDAAANVDVPSKLNQKINLHSFVCGIHLEGEEANKIASYPLVESFSYGADVTRLGERFGGFLTGLEVLGLGQPADSCLDDSAPPSAESGLSVHMGNVQIDTLMQLSIMVLAPPDGGAKSPDKGSDELLSEHSASENNAHISGSNDPSSFALPLSSASLVLFEESRFVVSGVNMRYRADGTVCILEADKMEYENDAKSRAAAARITITMRPVVKMTIECIESLYVADSFLLSNPIHSSEFTYEGNTMRILLDKLDVVTYSKNPHEGAQTNSLISAPHLPGNIDLCVQNGMQLKKSEDGSLTRFGGRFHLYALKEERSAKIAVQFESFRNYLFAANTVSFCASLPLDRVDTIDNFIFSAGDATMVRGHSTDEWSEAFQPRKQKVEQSNKSTNQPTPVIKLPFVSIADLKITIGLGASHKVGRVKDTSLIIAPFKGKAETTSKDLISYYTKAILSRAPDFISNAEVLGLNIVDTTGGLWATWAGVGLGLGAFGAGAGVAAITAVDAVKGAVDAGKRSRNVSEGADWKPGDLMRGLVQAAGEATRDGVAMRGKQGDGNLIDWTVGATSNTADYVVENKNRLGAAGAGGGGFLLGMALGGPVGAVIGGLVATATTGAALETLDEKGRLIENSKEKSKTKKGSDGKNKAKEYFA